MDIAQTLGIFRRVGGQQHRAGLFGQQHFRLRLRKIGRKEPPAFLRGEKRILFQPPAGERKDLRGISVPLTEQVRAVGSDSEELLKQQPSSGLIPLVA